MIPALFKWAVSELYGPNVCVLNKIHFLSIHSIFNRNNGIFLFFLIFILLETYFCLILPSAAVALIDVYLKVLYREVVVYSVFYREEKRDREGWKLPLNRVSSRSLEVPGRQWVFWALVQCPVRKGKGNIPKYRKRNSLFSWPTSANLAKSKKQ